MARDQFSLFSNSILTETVKPRWLGSDVDVLRGTAQSIMKDLPRFERRPFRVDNSIVNSTRDVIVRIPDSVFNAPVPVGVVSKSYSLLQHATCMQTCIEAVGSVGFKVDNLEAEAWITKYGERVKIRIRFPLEFRLDPGDGTYSDLEFVCNNSVDGSLRLSAELMWYRQICGNGLFVGTSLMNFRKAHNRMLDIGNMSEAVQISMDHAAMDRVQYREWKKKPIPRKHFVKWTDGALANAWGSKAAARLYHIVTDGRDCKAVNLSNSIPPSRCEVHLTDSVPGVSGGELDLYAISQSMSWLAGQQRDIALRDKRIAEIPDLLVLLREMN